jgi:hypothetical protein
MLAVNISRGSARACTHIVLFALLFGIGCARPSGKAGSEPGLIKVTLQADWYPQPEHGGFCAAVANGYYRDEGLDLANPARRPMWWSSKSPRERHNSPWEALIGRWNRLRMACLWLQWQPRCNAIRKASWFGKSPHPLFCRS